VLLILWSWIPHPDTKPPPAYGAPSTGLDLVWLVVMDAANALAEELVTRAYLITRLVRLMESRFQAIILSALLFASYHAYQGPDGALDKFFLGVLWGVFFLALGRVWPLVLAHMLLNIFWELAALRPAGP
jgi:membrane protease YdiL (CAAX protease family)